MKIIYFSTSLLVGLLLLIQSCHSHDHPHAADGSHIEDHEGHDHSEHDHATHPHVEPEAAVLSFTHWTEKTELFIEFLPLVINKEVTLIPHFSEMIDFKGIEEGTLTIRLHDDVDIIAENTTLRPNTPGIFKISIKPIMAGTFQLDFILKTPLLIDTISINEVKVYNNEAEAIAANPPTVAGDEISFSKEQTWKTDFAIHQATKQPIREVIHTSGEIHPIKGEEKIVSTRSSGIVFFKSKNLQKGREVRKGETLFNISSEGLLQSNMAEKYKIAKARIDKTKADFERAETLLAQQIIGQKEFEQRKMDFSIAEAEFQTLTNSYNTEGQTVIASMSGIVKHVLVGDGQFVEEGAPLVVITRNRRLILEGAISQKYLPTLQKIKTANFKTSYQKEVQSIKDYNGRLISYGKVIEEGSSFIPILFELDNLNELIPGSFVELFLLTNPIDDDLVIPKTALLQDYNVNYVYVQTGGESFEKREVTLGVDDGVNVQIITGIIIGEWVVTKGAYQIKMASMSASIPSHGHTH